MFGARAVSGSPSKAWRRRGAGRSSWIGAAGAVLVLFLTVAVLLHHLLPGGPLVPVSHHRHLGRRAREARRRWAVGGDSSADREITTSARLPRRRRDRIERTAATVDRALHSLALALVGGVAAAGAVAGASADGRAALSIRGLATPADAYAAALSAAVGVGGRGWECAPAAGGAPVLLRLGSINDDFCDCADGSDEPGTAACAGLSTAPARFHCAHRVAPLAASRVDDGVCDCCDGADEDRARGGAAACADVCAELEAAAARERAIADAGRARRAEYERRARAAAGRSDGGAAGVPLAFGALAGSCWKSADGEYAYEVCLYSGHGATQRPRHGGAAHSLGRQWRWSVPGSRGVLSGGDACPAGVVRSIEVAFACGAEGEALSAVRETSTCVYAVTLSTPAACAGEGAVAGADA